jgi:ADP-ribose pyrophosphatase YjhB (NUDIX family)
LLCIRARNSLKLKLCRKAITPAELSQPGHEAMRRNAGMLLVHPGGPFWARKDLGSWSIPKGEYEEWEDPLLAAVREFDEETGGQVG